MLQPDHPTLFHSLIVILLPQPREIDCRLCPRGDGYRCEQQKAQTNSHVAMHQLLALFHSRSTLSSQGGHAGRLRIRWHQNSSRKANCISRGVPEPTGVIGDTMLVFTVLMMLPKPVVFDGLNVDFG